MFVSVQKTIQSMKQKAPTDEHMEFIAVYHIFIFSLQAGSAINLLLVNIPYWLTSTVSHTHMLSNTHTMVLFLYAKQVATVTRRQCGRTGGSGGCQRTPLVALEHLLSV